MYPALPSLPGVPSWITKQKLLPSSKHRPLPRPLALGSLHIQSQIAQSSIRIMGQISKPPKQQVCGKQLCMRDGDQNAKPGPCSLPLFRPIESRSTSPGTAPPRRAGGPPGAPSGPPAESGTPAAGGSPGISGLSSNSPPRAMQGNKERSIGFACSNSPQNTVPRQTNEERSNE